MYKRTGHKLKKISSQQFLFDWTIFEFLMAIDRKEKKLQISLISIDNLIQIKIKL